jgi:molybdate transport system substrate-binding protein
MRALLAFVSICVFGPALAVAEPLRLYAAGSLGKVLPEIIAASGLPSDAVAAPVLGPAGALGQRLLSGEDADLFLSADLAAPRAVAAARGGLVAPFARNRMCVAAPKALGLDEAHLLDLLLSPGLRLATSTPGADPGGDYALEVFKKAEAARPGADKILTDKAMHLLGAPSPAPAEPGHSLAATIFLDNRADALLSYCSGAADLLAEATGLVSIAVPAELEPHPVYGLALLTKRPEAMQLALFLLSDKGQTLLAKGGFMPIASK